VAASLPDPKKEKGVRIKDIDLEKRKKTSWAEKGSQRFDPEVGKRKRKKKKKKKKKKRKGKKKTKNKKKKKKGKEKNS